MYRLLIIEDDEIISRQMQKYLQSWHYEVACVKDFKNIMQEFQTFDPDLCLLDITLPDMNGYY